MKKIRMTHKSMNRRVWLLGLSVCLLAWTILAASVSNLQAQCDLRFWGESFQYDSNGLNPRVAISGTTVVEVHNGGIGAGPLWYRVGQVSTSSKTIQWGNGFEYDSAGMNPSVAISDSTAVEVHNGTGGVGSLWYRVGHINILNKTIRWGSSFEYDTHGMNPSLAISGATVVEVHTGGNGAGPLWYRVGQVNTANNTIQWGNSSEYDSYGMNPSVAMLGATVVEVQNGGNGAGPLWYRVGQVNTSNKTIQWGNSSKYDEGLNPAVGLDIDGLVEVHNGGYGAGPLWYHSGHFSGTDTINWGQSYEYDSAGMNPSVSLTGTIAVEVHDGTDGPGPLWYRVGYFECVK
jgi:hypothetical protein